MGFRDNDVLFVNVGELIDRKNQLTAINAFAKAAIPNSYLLICGDGQQRGQLEKFVRQNKISNVYLLGFRQDVKAILALSDCFIFPSFQVGIPVALMEAMAAGIPCIASNIRGNVDLLGRDYKYLFNPYQAAELCHLMKEILRDGADFTSDYRSRLVPYEFSNVKREIKEIYSALRERSYSLYAS